ncbi:sugar phosphate isomerase/epimerase family protein [Sphingomonas profundi]|uniref:sugar phosphate isomerase/epimerase family protein n=1 Tax=Alterirhizorhabdus profundi TaxID=2681549 RepID=UPI0012E7639B|nr:sugar phosphate isomerase/epimerase [Sphingomonas profundi]
MTAAGTGGAGGHAISLASGVVPEFGPIETIDAAVAGGFDAVGLWIEPADWTDATTRAAKARLADAGLPLLDVEVVWIKPGPLDPDHLRIIDIGAEMGAANVLVVSSDPDQGATAAKFARLCAHGGERGMRIALEFGMFTDVKTIDQALAVIAAAGDPAAALLVDPIHLSRSGGSPEDVAAVPRHLLPYAQMCDAVAIGPDPHDFDGIIREAVDERLQTGEGALPLAAVMRALPDRVPLSIELRSKALRDAFPDPGARAKAVADATRRFLATLN